MDDTNGDFDSIQDAVDAADPGDTIQVEPGSGDYDEIVTISKPNLTLRGDPGDVDTVGPGSNAPTTEEFILEAGADGTTLVGFILDDELDDGVDITLAAGETISEVVLSYNLFDGSEIDIDPTGDGSGIQGFTIAWNDFRSDDIRIHPDGSDGFVRDVRIANNVLDNGSIFLDMNGPESVLEDYWVVQNELHNDPIEVDLDADDVHATNVHIVDNDVTGDEIFLELQNPGITVTNVRVEGNTLVDSQIEFEVESSANGSSIVDGRILNNTITHNGTGGIAIELDMSGTDDAAIDLLIACNRITNAHADAIELDLDEDDSNSYDIRISNNVIDGANRSGIEFFNLGGSGMSVEIEYNDISNVSDSGVEIQTGVGDRSGITVTNNNIQGNDVGLESDEAELVDARGNYWGAADGPSGGVEDPVTGATATGSGDVIEAATDAVRFDPFLTAPVEPPAVCGPDDARECKDRRNRGRGGSTLPRCDDHRARSRSSPPRIDERRARRRGSR